MNMKLGQDKARTTSKAKSKNARCISCRKCYNTGICLMQWPGFGPTEHEGVAKDGKGNPKSNA